MGAAKPEKKEKRRQGPLATSFGCAAMLLLVGACARAGDGEAIASSDGGTSFVPDADPGSGPPPTDANSANPGETSSGVEDGSLSAADVGLQKDAGREGASESSTHGVNEDAVDGATATDDAADAADVMADTEAASIVDEPDAMVGGGGDDLSLPCAQTCTSGCCDPSGTCLDGVTDEACGGGGNACQDCSPAGQTCQSNACQAPSPSPTPPPPDAGGPTCDVSSCSNLCVPYFVQCCKSDSTCGCALLFPRGPCN
jgi:hypothetical protein